MYSEVIPWEEFLGAVSDETGIEDLSNKENMIRRSVYRTERDIGFGGSIILKKKTYEIIDDAASPRFKLPEDIIRIEEVGTCAIGFCPGTYKIQGNYVFICDDRIVNQLKEFKLFYYTLWKDENSNPVITSNHYEALIVGAALQLYKAKRHNEQGNANQFGYYLNEYDQRVGEARGSDVMPTTEEEWREISQILTMSKREFLIYDIREKKYCCGSDDKDIQIDITTVYYWQFDTIDYDPSFIENVSLAFLEQQSNQPLTTFQTGFNVPYTEIGRIGFAIRTSQENQYSFYDQFNQNITNIVFDSYYDESLQAMIYVSKIPYTIGSVYFKIN